MFDRNRYKADVEFLELRRAIVNFTSTFAKQMHVYCDPITQEETPKVGSKGALYGDADGLFDSTEDWNEMMVNVVKASYAAADLKSPNFQQDEWNKKKGYVPTEYSRPSGINDEIEGCETALNFVGNCCSTLFQCLAEDDQNENRQKDSQQRQALRHFTIDVLANLILLAEKASDVDDFAYRQNSFSKETFSMFFEGDDGVNYKKCLLGNLTPSIVQAVEEEVQDQKPTFSTKPDK